MSVKYEWKIPDIALFNMKKFTPLMQTQIRTALLRMTNVVRTNVMRNTPVGVTAQLKNSIFAQVSKNIGKVFPGIKYAYFVEHGRNPGRMPPINAILQWLRLAPAGRSLFAEMSSAGMLTGNAASRLRQAAFIVSRSIGMKGTKGTKFFSKGIQQSKSTLEKEQNNLLTNLKKGLVK